MSEITRNTPMAPGPALDWALDDAVGHVPEALNAVLFSTDGFAKARSSGLDKETAERTAAAGSALLSMAKGTAEVLGDPKETPLREALFHYRGGYLLLVQAGEGACVGVSATERVDVEVFTTRVHLLVKRLGEVMSSRQRDDIGSRPA